MMAEVMELAALGQRDSMYEWDLAHYQSALDAGTAANRVKPERHWPHQVTPAVSERARAALADLDKVAFPEDWRPNFPVVGDRKKDVDRLRERLLKIADGQESGEYCYPVRR
jgi:hypothetical protein